MLCIFPGRLITSKLLSLPLSLLNNWRSHRHPPASLKQKEKKKKRASKCSSNKPANTQKKKPATLPEEQQQPLKQNKIKQTKSSNSNEIPTRESKTVSNKLQLQTKSTTPGKTQFKCSRPDTKRMAKTQRESRARGRQRETRERAERAERRRARQRARQPREMRERERTRRRLRERERTRRRLRERERRARTQLVKFRDTELKAARNRKSEWSRTTTTTPLQPRLPTLLFYSFVWLPLTRGSVQNWCFFIIP